MTQIIDSPSAVNLSPIHLSYAAVREGRAQWRYDRPIDACAAVEMGEASWMWDEPREITIIVDEDEPIEPCPCPWYDPTGITPWDDPSELRDDEGEGEYPTFEPSEADEAEAMKWFQVQRGPYFVSARLGKWAVDVSFYPAGGLGWGIQKWRYMTSESWWHGTIYLERFKIIW